MTKGALEGPRMLHKSIPAYAGARGASSWEGNNGWEADLTNDMLMYETYFDTSGYSLDDLTLFPMGVTLQDPGRYICSNGNVPVQVLDIISQVRIELNDVYAWVVANNMPGMPGTTVDYTQILWGQYRTMLPQASFTGFGTEVLAASQTLFGSGSPSTAEKIYLYRFVVLPGSTDLDTLYMPASRFVLDAVIAGESELAFLMRQKRSYELAQT